MSSKHLATGALLVENLGGVWGFHWFGV